MRLSLMAFLTCSSYAGTIRAIEYFEAGVYMQKSVPLPVDSNPVPIMD
jgi:hypothetical protein